MAIRNLECNKDWCNKLIVAISFKIIFKTRGDNKTKIIWIQSKFKHHLVQDKMNYTRRVLKMHQEKYFLKNPKHLLLVFLSWNFKSWRLLVFLKRQCLLSLLLKKSKVILAAKIIVPKEWFGIFGNTEMELNYFYQQGSQSYLLLFVRNLARALL